MIKRLEQSTGKVLGYRISGTLHDEDYKYFVPEVDAKLADYDKVRLLMWFDGFHGMDLHAVWDDLVFGATHFNKLERIALVGDKAWEAKVARIFKPMTRAEVAYFDVHEMDQAWSWINAPMPACVD